jgi:hypothetical protein
MSQQVIINIGVSGAGKTTWSTNYMAKNIGNYRINRDSIRTQLVGTLDGYYQRKDLNFLENLVTELEEQYFVKFLQKGISIIVDNTNLKPSYIQKWLDLVHIWNVNQPELKKVQVKFKIFPEDNAHFLKKRVNVRDAPLGWDKLNYIDKQVISLKDAISFVERNYKDQIFNE